jgi:hypothetical protein
LKKQTGEHSMRRPVGVVVAASVLGVIGLLGLIGVVLSFAGVFLMKNPMVPQGTGVEATIGAADLFFAGTLVFCVWTAVGLFRLRPWARYSIIVIGALVFAFCSIVSALMFVLRHFAPTLAGSAGAAAAPAALGTVFVAIGLFYAAVALIGVWWVVYFSLRSVGLAFATGGTSVTVHEAIAASAYGPWRTVVVVLACFMLLGGAALLAMAWLRPPFFLLGVVFRGNASLAVALVLAALDFFIGVGLLVRLRAAFWTALVYEAFGVLSMILMLIPGYTARALAAGSEFSRRFVVSPGINSSAMVYMQQQFLVLVGIFVLAIMLLFIYALLRCRHWYLGEGPGALATGPL